MNDDLIIVGGDNLFTFELSDFVNFAKKMDNCAIGLYNINKEIATTTIGRNNNTTIIFSAHY